MTTKADTQLTREMLAEIIKLQRNLDAANAKLDAITAVLNDRTEGAP